MTGYIQRILRRIRRSGANFSSPDYWEQRYKSGGSSGEGSRQQLAAYKAKFINQFISENGLKSLTELGCGDGVQLGMFDTERYIGLDISPTAVKRCSKMYQHDDKKHFDIYRPGHFSSSTYRSDAALSLDVLYHLVEEDIFEQHLKDLFSLGEKFIIIYACDREPAVLPPVGRHLKWRRFTPYLEEHFPDWKCIAHEKNPYSPEVYGKSHGSYADFFVFARINRS